MDRDTIIDGLRMTMDLCVFDPSTGEEKDPDDLNDLDRATYDACKGALEILERLDTDSDTISRAKAIEAIDRERKNKHLFNTAEDGLLEARKAINTLPSAQPERIKGHWIKISPANIYECSECGKNVMTNDICTYDFCHGCGAEMEVTT